MKYKCLNNLSENNPDKLYLILFYTDWCEPCVETINIMCIGLTSKIYENKTKNTKHQTTNNKTTKQPTPPKQKPATQNHNTAQRGDNKKAKIRSNRSTVFKT